MKCADVYNVFFNPGEVTEIRAFGLSGKRKAWEGFARGAGTVYGYFDNAEDFGKCAEALDAAAAPGIYFVLNPVIPDLLARAANRLKAADMKTATTSDQDVLCLRWLYIDLDPIRRSGISSSDDELKAAITLRNKIHRHYRDKHKHTVCVPAMSGNGAHLLIALNDIENDVTPRGAGENVSLIKKALEYLHAEFSTDLVEVDRTVFNPARMCKVYGTVARKGDSIKQRPHRRSYIEEKFLNG